MKENFKFKTIFSSIVRPLVSEEKDKYLALASQLDIEKFIPNIDISREIDLLPLAFNACVANRVNRNGDVIDTNTAIEIYKSFINKPINVEHNRQRVIGTVLVAGFSEFGTDKPLEEEDIKDSTIPFNITLGGVAWKVVNPELSDVIEESNDPTSKHYLKISASWELGFSDYNLVVTSKEDKNIESATIISNEQEIEALKECLKALGGSGQTEDGRYIYRKVVGQVVPLGIGLTETPAADVQGVIVPSKASKDEPSEVETEVETEGEVKEPKELKQLNQAKEKENSISQSNEKNVKKEKRLVMKIKSLKDINDENLKELSASAISEFIEEELNKATESYLAEKQEVNNKLKATEEELADLKKSADTSSEDLEKVKADLEALQKEAAAKEAEIKFVNRMTSLDEGYVLSDEDREVLAFEIKSMSDDDFETFSKKMEILMDSKKREVVEAAEAEKAEAEVSETKQTNEAKASETTPEEVEKPVSEVVDEAIESSETEASDVPVSAEAEEPTVFEKYQSAFSPENWIQK